MRSLKFRAWDKVTKRYWNVGGLGFEKDRLIEVYLDNYPTTLEGNEDCKKPDEVILEQYIGLKDKDGNEIYEGDIVQIDSIDELRVGFVDLLYDQYCIVYGEDDEGRKIVAEFYYYSKPEENCKVIGNINENPELLEGENEQKNRG